MNLRLSSLLGALLALLGLWCSTAALAQPTLSAGDYGLENLEWNGLSQFMALAQGQGAQVLPQSSLDFGSLGPEDRLVVLFPSQEIDTDEFARFIIDGGRVMLADDFGQSENLLQRLGIERRSLDSIKHDNLYLGRPGLPMVEPGGRHALLEGVEEVVANHPTVLQTQGGAILPFAQDGTGLVYDMKLGRGKVVAMGDASLMINHMIGVKDNRAFLRNTIDYLCKEVDPCKIHLLVGDVEVTGSYQSKNESPNEFGDILEDGLGDINAWLEQLADGLPGRNAIYYASLLLLLGTVAFVVTVFPWRRALQVAPVVGPPSHIKPLSEFEWNLLRYQHSGVQANYALPVTILKQEFERLFFETLAPGEDVPEQDEPQRGPFVRRVVQAYVDRHDGEGRTRAKVYKQTLALVQTLGEVPPRHRLFLDSEAYFNERELVRIYRQCREILDTLGVGKEYERRTRRKQGKHPS